MMKTSATSLVLLLAIVAAVQAQNKRDIAVRKDRHELSEDTSWIYDDLEAALDAARTSRRPLMIVFR